MKNVFINIPDTDTVKKFVNTLSDLDGEFELISGKHILDARSMMGIFSFDLSKPVELKIYNDTTENMTALDAFIAQ